MKEELEKAYEYLISNSSVAKDKINEAFKESQEKDLDIFEVLVEKKFIGEEDAAKEKADFLKLQYIDLKGIEIGTDVLKEVPEKAALFYKFIPFERLNNVLKVAMIDPTDLDALDALKFISTRHNVDTEIYVVSRSCFNYLAKQYREFNEELEDVLRNVDQEIVKRKKTTTKKKSKVEMEQIEEEAPVSKIVDIIITHAVEGRASDIHIEPSENELRVRYRLDGVLHNSLILPGSISSAVISRVKILSSLKIDETRKPQDGRFRFDISSNGNFGKSVDLRVSTFPTVNGEKVVMRILDTSSDIGSLENLGIWKRGLNIINENIKKPFGIILVTGPTGSGKSTTLYAVLKILNKEGVNIVTLEDPVEYYMVGVNQSQVKPEVGYTFASGLRAILRQDPDIIMVGEIRDKETAELATHAALTGHLVLATLHTNNAVGVIPRLIDMGIEPFLISSSLNVAVGQRLVRKICSHCKEEFTPSAEIRKIIASEMEKVPKDQKEDLNLGKEIKLFRGSGCKDCKQSGFSGRIGIYEVLSMTSELESLMSSKITENEIVKEAERQGMTTMRQDGIMKALKGITTIEEVIRASEE